MSAAGDGLTSMTGYGRATARVRGWRLRVECRSVNHKRLSLRMDVPDELTWLEPRIDECLRGSVARGRIKIGVELHPTADGDEGAFDRIDEDRFEVVVRRLARLADDLELATPVSVGAVNEYRDFFEQSGREVFERTDDGELMEVVERALEEMVESRRAEGRDIGDDLRRLTGRLERRLDEVQQRRSESEEQRRAGVKARLREAVNRFDVDEIDENRLAREVAYYVEKGDIAEEIQRTRSHLQKLGELLDDPPEEAVGKKIDFYLQELVRETNTMSSKSRHPGLTESIIEMKSLVEKMREQAANVE